MEYQKAIEVVKNEKECVLRNIQGCDRKCGKCDLVMEDKAIIEGFNAAISALEEIQQYRTIGTIPECRAAREKQKMKSPFKTTDGHMNCAICEEVVIFPEEYCQNCGQRIDWSDEN